MQANTNMSLKVATYLRSTLASLLGQSFNGARDLYTVLGYPKDVLGQQLIGMYQRNDVANRIICAFPSATWRDCPVIRDEAGDSADEDSDSYSPFVHAIEDSFDKYRAWHYIQRADRLSSLGRFGLLVMGFAGTAKMSDPLEEGQKARLIYLAPYHEDNIQIATWDTDIRSPRYGRPLTYNVQQGNMSGKSQVQTRSFLVHWTRCIHISEVLDGDDVFGTPRLLPIFNRLMDLEKVVGGSAETFWLNARPGIMLSADKDAQLTEDDIAAMKTQSEDFSHQLRRTMAMQGVTAQSLNAQIADPGPNVDKLLDLIAGAIGMPKRILIGSEMGQLASGQDENNWATRIDERREQFATPSILRPFVQKMIDTGNLPEPKGAWWVEWPEAGALGPQAQADIGQKKAATLQSYLSTPGAEIVVPPQEFRTDFLGMTPVSEYDAPEQEMPLPEEPTDDPAADDGEETPPVEEGDAESKTPVVNAEKKTLYVCRPVLNGKDIRKWAKKQGFKTTLLPDDMHVTIAYSKTKVDWMKVDPAWSYSVDNDGKLKIGPGGPRMVEQFDKGAVVLLFSSSDLKYRHDAIGYVGASWDYDEYQPHITITYDPGDVDLSKVEPYQGEIILGPEKFEEINSDLVIVENKKKAKKHVKKNSAKGNKKRAKQTSHAKRRARGR